MNEATKNIISEKRSFSKYPDILDRLRLEPDGTLVEPEAILSISNGEGRLSHVATLGNFSVIIGRAKARKTFLLTSIVAAALDGKCSLTNIRGNLPKDKRIVWFDTENSKYHFNVSLLRVEKQVVQYDHERIKAFSLKNLSVEDRLGSIDWYIANTPELGLVVIDGIRDLLKRGINDEIEATEFINKLLRWTSEHNIHIVVVLHQNKNDNNARGHIGTELVNKAETTLSVTKESNNKEISKVNPDYCRNIDFEPFRFRIDENELPILIEQNISKDHPLKSKVIENLKEVFKNNPVMKYTELVSSYKALTGNGQATAKRHIKDATDTGFLSKSNDGYRIKDQVHIQIS